MFFQDKTDTGRRIDETVEKTLRRNGCISQGRLENTCMCPPRVTWKQVLKCAFTATCLSRRGKQISVHERMGERVPVLPEGYR